jgi:hypothetical protein
VRNFDYIILKNKKWDNEILSYVAKIYKCKGNQEFYIKQKHVKLDELVKISKIHNTESSNHYVVFKVINYLISIIFCGE